MCALPESRPLASRIDPAGVGAKPVNGDPSRLILRRLEGRRRQEWGYELSSVETAEEAEIEAELGVVAVLAAGLFTIP